MKNGSNISYTIVMGVFVSLCLLCVFYIQNSYALPTYDRMFEQQYKYSPNCLSCHILGGGSQTTSYGKDFLRYGANLKAFDNIAQKDSDGDGFSNLEEIQARSNPGDSKSTPKKPGDWLAISREEESFPEGSDQGSKETEKSTGEEKNQLDFNSPQTEATSTEKGLNVGPISNINFGGLLDLRYVASSDNKAGNLVIHVNELVVSANVTDNISLLLEYLLPTSELISLVGDDHGFATALISNLPHLPVGTALKVGRYRFKYGVDARLDAPSNPLYPLVRRNLGIISDLGIELSGFLGPVSYYASVLNGPDHLEIPIADTSNDHESDNEMKGSLGTSIVPIDNSSKPIAIRLTTELPGSLELGFSYFEGFSWSYMNGMHIIGAHAPGGPVDKSSLLFKRRYSIDGAYRFWKLDLLGEANRGQDFMGEMRADVQGYYGRIDFNLLPRKLILSGQYDLWDDGLTDTVGEQTVSGALTYYFNNQVFIRVAYSYQKLNDSPRPNIGTVQFYLPY